MDVRKYVGVTKGVESLEQRIPKPQPEPAVLKKLKKSPFFQKAFKLPIRQGHLIAHIVVGLLGTDV